jgi:hypothetical protein
MNVWKDLPNGPITYIELFDQQAVRRVDGLVKIQFYSPE